MKIAIIGLTISSSWGNGHATTFRSLVKALDQAGHSVSFYEQDVYWYACARDLPDPPYCRLILYRDHYALADYKTEIASADLVIVGSFVQDGIAVGDWVLRHANGIKAFYDIDTPVTLAELKEGRCSYLHPEQISKYDLFLSLSDGPALQTLKADYQSPCAVLFPCSVDPEVYYPKRQQPVWDLGYMGTYSNFRQQSLKRLLVNAAEAWPDGRFVVAGSMYPEETVWPDNVERIHHISPPNHCAFYNSQRFTLNLTRKEMVKAGHSPSVRLFEAAACGVPIITDRWAGIEDFLTPGTEILIADSHAELLHFIRGIPEEERLSIGNAAREKILQTHTAAHRARQLEGYVSSFRELVTQQRVIRHQSSASQTKISKT